MSHIDTPGVRGAQQRYRDARAETDRIIREMGGETGGLMNALLRERLAASDYAFHIAAAAIDAMLGPQGGVPPPVPLDRKGAS